MAVDDHGSRFTSTTTPTRRRSALALLSAGGLLLAGCGVIPGIGGGTQTREVAVRGLVGRSRQRGRSGAGMRAAGDRDRHRWPICGRTAGGLLTVATTAALNNKVLRPDATMTGAIAPDGSIGPVSGVPNKLVAAKAAGFKVVAIPASLTQAKDLRTNQLVNTVALGRSLGIRVVPVASVQHAYAELVGPWPYQAAVKVPPLDPSVADFLKQRVADYQAKVAIFTKQLGAAPKLVGDDQELYRDMGKSSAAAAAAGPESVVSYYGGAAGAFESMLYLAGRLKQRKNLQSSQLAAITTTTRESIDQLERSLTAQINAGASTAPVWLEQLTAQADSTGWINSGLTSLFSARETLDTLSSSPQPEQQESLVEVAGTIEAATAWGTLGADGSKVASMIGRLPVPPGAGDHLSKPNPNAVAYYVYGTLLVTGVSALGAYGDVLEIGDSSTELKNVTAIADVAQQSANYGMQSLSARGADVSYLQWNTSWGHLMAEGLLDATDAHSRAYGLIYMWYMNILIPITLELASDSGE